MRSSLSRRVPVRVFGVAAVGFSVVGCDMISPLADSPNAPRQQERCGGSPELTALAWNEESELGSAEQVFQGIEGQCNAVLRWLSGSEAALDLDPESEAAMSVDVQLDHDSARLVTHTDARDRRAECPRGLEVDAAVRLSSNDGQIDAKAKTKVRFQPGSALTFGFTLANEDHRGSLALRERQGETTTLNFDLDGAGANCAGDIMLSTASMSADGTGRGAAGRIGSWSASGCPTGQAAFDLAQDVGGGTLPELLDRAWNRRVFDGTWRDGSHATLSLQVEPLDKASCVERRAQAVTVTLPVEVRYSTDDGRLEQRVAAANVRAELSQAGEVHQLGLWISDELTCTTTGSQLAYTQADCAQLKAATVQLGLNSSDGASSVPTDGGLNVYFVPRFGDELPKPDTLSL